MRTVAAILVAFVLLLLFLTLACQPQPATPPSPPPPPAPSPSPASAPVMTKPTPTLVSPTPKPTPPPPPTTTPLDPELIMRKLESDLMTVNNAMLNFVTAYPPETYQDVFVIKIPLVIARDPNIGERIYYRRIVVTNIVEAKKYIANAYSLAKNRRLETETAPRNVTPEEVSAEVDKALVFLKKQVAYTVLDVLEAIKWAKESTIPGVNQDSTFKNITENYDKYRAKIADMGTILERILSYSPKKGALPPTRSV